MTEKCGYEFISPAGALEYVCDRLKDHEGRHKQKIIGSNPPATFSWPNTDKENKYDDLSA